LLRATVLVFVAAVAVFLWRAGEEPIRALETPALRPAPGVFETSRPASEQEVAFEERRVGSFERPESVPAYEILEERPTGSDDLRSARLLVDTRSRSQENFTLITRDLKASYADYDFVSVEFTDVSVVLDYHGGAVIVNTPVGSQRAGFIFAPPSQGYYVRAAQ
jgi:HAMP domain-containing protein